MDSAIIGAAEKRIAKGQRARHMLPDQPPEKAPLRSPPAPCRGAQAFVMAPQWQTAAFVCRVCWMLADG
jgi:hypothetical protein